MAAHAPFRVVGESRAQNRRNVVFERKLLSPVAERNRACKIVPHHLHLPRTLARGWYWFLSQRQKLPTSPTRASKKKRQKAR